MENSSAILGGFTRGIITLGSELTKQDEENNGLTPQSPEVVFGHLKMGEYLPR